MIFETLVEVKCLHCDELINHDNEKPFQDLEDDSLKLDHISYDKKNPF